MKLKEELILKTMKKDFEILFKNGDFDKEKTIKILRYFLIKVESM
ncbi:hypothetical protein [Aliivibrio fischeri]|uniref:Uncharacterized protein n=1 Tax=Aliivibrio fischeri TaxID=668 RepID=A0A510URV5_ALIFS|nr:hypothetical protein [Aliivibrio fischeri]GEK15970.1 hypothetical protein AFI02nite_40060 [Aliivibrio fischeri]